MKETFSRKLKILFVCLAQSSHTHSWVELLENQEIDVRVFGINDTQTPDHFKFPAYSFSQSFPWLKPKKKRNSHFIKVKRRLLKLFLYLIRQDVSYLEHRWLIKVINDWQPDIIHTLGLDPASFTYYNVKLRYHLRESPIWIVTARGGPEFSLKRSVPEEAVKIRDVLNACDQFISDNQQNYDHALKLGLDPKKVSTLGVVPGTGGVNVDRLNQIGGLLPSERQRIIVWPKAYECPASKALPVFEAFRLCWESIRPCEVYMTAMIPETRMWFETLPHEIKNSCHTEDRIARENLLELMARSRVMLAPSLSDGIPNTLYEAMATGAFPIVSPLDTIQSVVSKESVLFARNLYPQEIADALIRAMNDDQLVNKAARKNLLLVKRMADRNLIASKVVNYYKSIKNSIKYN